VSLPGDTARAGQPVWFGDGKLAADLSWPRQFRRWAVPQQPVPDWTAGERQRLWEYAAEVADYAAKGGTVPACRERLRAYSILYSACGMARSQAIWKAATMSRMMRGSEVKV
jgi:hypothetical protein